MIESDKQYKLVDGIWKEIKTTGKDVMINECPMCGGKDIVKNVLSGQFYCRTCMRWIKA